MFSRDSMIPKPGAGLARAALSLLCACAVEEKNGFKGTVTRPKAGAGLARDAFCLLRACAVGKYRQ